MTSRGIRTVVVVYILLNPFLFILAVASVLERVQSRSNPIPPMSNTHKAFPTSNITSPGHVPFDVQNYPIPPPGLALEQVHLFVRHGERTPVGIRMSEPPASIPSHWMFCHEGRKFRAAVASFSGHDTLNVRRVVEREDGTLRDGECLLGELTDIGRQSTFNLGVALRKLYVERLGFLPDTAHNSAAVYYRSTNLPRTIESLQQVAHGLYPSTKQGPDFVSNIRIRNPKDENLFGNTVACNRLKDLMLEFATASLIAYNQILKPLDEKLSKFIGGKPVRLDGKPRASGILDTVHASVAHGIKLPPELQDKNNLGLIEKAVVAEWFSVKDEEGRRLGFGRLLNETSRKMNKKATIQNEDPLKILIHTTHDTALAGLSQTLDVFDEKWPAFTATMSFELFKGTPDPNKDESYLQRFLTSLTSTGQSQKHYVRMRYQNKNIILPLCQEAGKHLEGYPEFCTLGAFSQRVKELTPVDWEAECM